MNRWSRVAMLAIVTWVMVACASERSSTIASTTGASTTTTSTPLDWSPIARPLAARLTLDDVPRLVPAPLARGGTLVRSGPDDLPADSAEYIQEYFNADGSVSLVVATHLKTPGEPNAFDRTQRIGPWSFSQSVGGELLLETATAKVTLSSSVLGFDQLTTIAGQMRQGTNSGWDLGPLPNGLRLVAEAPSRPWVARRVTGTDQTGLVYAVEVTADWPSLLHMLGADASSQVVDVGGIRAIYSQQAMRAGRLGTLVWEYAPRIVVRLGIVDVTKEQLIQAATSLRNVTADEWNALPAVTIHDGCPAFWC